LEALNAKLMLLTEPIGDGIMTRDEEELKRVFTKARFRETLELPVRHGPGPQAHSELRWA